MVSSLLDREFVRNEAHVVVHLDGNGAVDLGRTPRFADFGIRVISRLSVSMSSGMLARCHGHSETGKERQREEGLNGFRFHAYLLRVISE